MNKKFQSYKIEDIIFFDAEVVRANKELEIDSREYELFQKKTRNRDTDEFLTDEELMEEYEKRAALKRGYSKIITIGVGFVKDGIPYIKDISGEEEYVIKEFVKIANKFKYNCSFNGIAFDLPIIVGNGMKYFNIAEKLKDDFNPSGKKPWNLDMCIDLMDIFKGSHYYPNSLDEVCYHFNIPSPKDGIDGSEVSDIYYNGDRGRIYEYVKKDVLANINVFLKMQGKGIFTDFVDRSSNKAAEGEFSGREINPIVQLIETKDFNDEVKEGLEKILEGKKVLKKDREILQDIVTRTAINDQMFKSDSAPIRAAKTKEVEEFFKTKVK